LSRETLKDFLISKGSTQDSISITQKNAPDGLGVEPGTNEELLDLLDDTKGLLGDYLKFLVDQSTNEFKLKGGNALVSSNNRGDAIQLADSQGAESVHVSQGTILKSKLNENSNSNKFDNSGTPISSLVDKTSSNFSNHDLLKDIPGKSLSKSGATLTNSNGEDNDVVQATQRVLLQNNRFANVGSDTNTAFTVKP